MITLAKKEDKNKIQALYQRQGMERGYLNFYFAIAYNQATHYLIKDEDNLKAVLSVFKHDLMLHQKKLRVSYLTNLFTAEANATKAAFYREHLFNEVLKVLEFQDLLSVMPVKLLSTKDNGFKPAFNSNIYEFNRETFKIQAPLKLSEGGDSLALLGLYRLFTKRFNAYYYRDKAYYDRYILQLEFEKKKLYSLYEGDELKAYCTFKVYDQYLMIEECLYADIKSLVYLIANTLAFKEKVYLRVSEFERLERLFPEVVYHREEDLALRINDYRLFNELYNSQITDVSTALNLSAAPLYLKEVF